MNNRNNNNNINNDIKNNNNINNDIKQQQLIALIFKKVQQEKQGLPVDEELQLKIEELSQELQGESQEQKQEFVRGALRKNFENLENNFVPIRELQADLPEIQKAKQENIEVYKKTINGSSDLILKRSIIEEFWQHLKVLSSELYTNSVLFYSMRIKVDTEWYEEEWEETRYQYYNEKFNIFKNKIKEEKRTGESNSHQNESESEEEDIIFNVEEKKEIRIYKAWYAAYRYVDFIKHRLLKLELTEFVYLVIEEIGVGEGEYEERERGFPELHVIFGMKNLIGVSEKLLVNLKENFSTADTLNSDIKEFKALETKKEIQDYWYQLIKKIRHEDKTILFQNHFFYLYSGSKLTGYNLLDVYMEVSDLEQIFGEYKYLPHKHKEIKLLFTSQHINLRAHPELQLLNLWNAYCQIANIIYYENKLYRKNKKSKYTYESLGGLEYFLTHQEIISCELSNDFWFQLNNEIIKEIYSEGYEKAYQKIKEQPHVILPNRIKVYEHLIEYEDGIYNIKEERYLEYEKIEKYLWKEWLKEGLTMWIGCSRFINNKFKKNKKIKKMNISVKGKKFLSKEEQFMAILEFLSFDKKEQEKIKLINEELYIFK